MAENPVSPSSENTLSAEDVEGYIKYSGKYKIAEPKTGKRVGKHFSLLRNIVDERGDILRQFYYCTGCKGVIQHDAKKGTASLNRHVNDCGSKGNEVNDDDDDEKANEENVAATEDIVTAPTESDTGSLTQQVGNGGNSENANGINK